MKLKDIYKDYAIPVDELEWEKIANDASVKKYNRIRLLRRICLYGIIPAVVVGVVALWIVTTSPSKEKQPESLHSKVTQTKNLQECSAQKPIRIASSENNRQVASEQVIPIVAKNDLTSSGPAQNGTLIMTENISEPLVKQIPSISSSFVASAPLQQSANGTAPSASKTIPVVETKAQESKESAVEPVEEEPVAEYEVFIPNAFSPNGDGINDLFKVEAGFEPKSFEIAIYSRRGELVFTNRDVKLGWDGTYRGRNLPAEVYPYIVTYTTPDGDRISRRGQITLIR